MGELQLKLHGGNAGEVDLAETMSLKELKLTSRCIACRRLHAPRLPLLPSSNLAATKALHAIEEGERGAMGWDIDN
ncbi:hypothetical protein E2562_036045 [Oryza meyeriana var. granulata]|uniref:Uncharacterized protein n=1 Tax=Oryza meyeriana var. granulata TaxID=110450 RepID=A0A6G1DAG3_9ORYZ|nr:hypothetical protein E2562_036045 [Oryza meyeriana var. granulata]